MIPPPALIVRKHGVVVEIVRLRPIYIKDKIASAAWLNSKRYPNGPA